jgi:hypothetical protein
MPTMGNEDRSGAVGLATRAFGSGLRVMGQGELERAFMTK